MLKNLQNNTYTCYNNKCEVDLSEYQIEVLSGLLSGEISRKKLTELRGNARRYRNLSKSIELSTVNEIYKYEEKYEEGKVP